MKKQFPAGMMRCASAIGVTLGLGSWISPILFFVIATSTQLNWWHPSWGSSVKNTLLFLLVVSSTANGLLYVGLNLVSLRLRARLQRDDRTPRRRFNFATLTLVYVLLTSWGVLAQTGHPSRLLFWCILVVWCVSGVGGVALELHRLRHNAVQQRAH